MINPEPVPSQSSPYSSANNYNLSRAIPTPLAPKKRSSWKKYFFLSVFSLIIAGGTYTYAQYAALRNTIITPHEGESSTILSYNEGSNLDPQAFTQAGDGRFNVLILGIGGDNHPGGTLTDSIQILSVDTLNKKASLISLPRDLYVDIPGYGRAKLNYAYFAGEETRVGNGAVLSREVVGKVVGAKISNYVLVDFQGAEEIINALGGIEVEVPKAISDPLFPADNGTVEFRPFYIDAGLQHMNGETALKYARSRETTSDFDRSARQQLIISALRQKALSLGVITNPLKVAGLMGTVGRHLKTDLRPDELRAFLALYKDIPPEASSSYVLDTSQELGLLTSETDPVVGYIAYPLEGYFKFGEVQRWFHRNNPDPLIAREGAKVMVINGGKATAAQMTSLVDTLRDYGYNAELSNLSPKRGPEKTQVLEKRGGKKPITANYLGSYFSLTPKEDSLLNPDADFEIIYVPPLKK